MGVPTGEIIARPMVARACGCLQEFQHYAVDRYRAQRLAKFQQTRCTECVNKLNEEHRQAAAALPKKGEAFQLLPPGTQVSITRHPDGTWAGALSASGTKVEASGDGPQGVIVALARLWVVTHKGAASPAANAAPKPTATAAVKPAPSVAPKPVPKPAPKPV